MVCNVEYGSLIPATPCDAPRPQVSAWIAPGAGKRLWQLSFDEVAPNNVGAFRYTGRVAPDGCAVAGTFKHTVLWRLTGTFAFAITSASDDGDSDDADGDAGSDPTHVRYASALARVVFSSSPQGDHHGGDCGDAADGGDDVPPRRTVRFADARNVLIEISPRPRRLLNARLAALGVDVGAGIGISVEAPAASRGRYGGSEAAATGAVVSVAPQHPPPTPPPAATGATTTSTATTARAWAARSEAYAAGQRDAGGPYAPPGGWYGAADAQIWRTLRKAYRGDESLGGGVGGSGGHDAGAAHDGERAQEVQHPFDHHSSSSRPLSSEEEEKEPSKEDHAAEGDEALLEALEDGGHFTRRREGAPAGPLTPRDLDQLCEFHALE